MSEEKGFCRLVRFSDANTQARVEPAYGAVLRTQEL